MKRFKRHHRETPNERIIVPFPVEEVDVTLAFKVDVTLAFKVDVTLAFKVELLAVLMVDEFLTDSILLPRVAEIR